MTFPTSVSPGTRPAVAGGRFRRHAAFRRVTVGRRVATCRPGLLTATGFNYAPGPSYIGASFVNNAVTGCKWAIVAAAAAVFPPGGRLCGPWRSARVIGTERLSKPKNRIDTQWPRRKRWRCIVADKSSGCPATEKRWYSLGFSSSKIYGETYMCFSRITASRLVYTSVH